MIKIRFATPEDRENIIGFLHDNWSDESILVRSRKIFEFQYTENCNFVIAVDEDDKIYGLKGYFLFNNEEQPDVAAALAIVLQGVRPMLGMEIQRFLEKETNSRWVCSTGLNPNTSVRVYKLFRNAYTVDKLKHYYRLSESSEYKIAAIKNKNIISVAPNETKLLHLQSIDELCDIFDLNAIKGNRPFKDAAYLNYRYFDHPLYEYTVLGVKKPICPVTSLIIGRKVEQNGSKAFRIVDFMGEQEDLSFVGAALDDLLCSNDFEYVDMYCYGIDHEHLTLGGFSLKADDVNIIPNYFEPYVKKNVNIYFFYTGLDKAIICKADGDQDRPNVVPKELLNKNE
jgi:hypothetical protein